MITKELAEQVRTEVKHLKEAQDKFLQTYKRVCVHCGGPEWQKAEIEIVFYDVRKEAIPIMDKVGMDHKAVQSLCSWAENLTMNQ